MTHVVWCVISDFSFVCGRSCLMREIAYSVYLWIIPLFKVWHCVVCVVSCYSCCNIWLPMCLWAILVDVRDRIPSYVWGIALIDVWYLPPSLWEIVLKCSVWLIVYICVIMFSDVCYPTIISFVGDIIDVVSCVWAFCH